MYFMEIMSFELTRRRRTTFLQFHKRKAHRFLQFRKEIKCAEMRHKTWEVGQKCLTVTRSATMCMVALSEKDRQTEGAPHTETIHAVP